MKKNVKRWLALLLAVALIASSGLYSSDSWLKANEDQNTGYVSTDEAEVNTDANDKESVVETESSENPTQGTVSQTQHVIIDTDEEKQSTMEETHIETEPSMSEPTTGSTESEPQQTESKQLETITAETEQTKEDEKNFSAASYAMASRADNRAQQSRTSTCTITPTIQNAQVAYIYFTDSTGANNNPLTPVSGSSTISEFTTSNHAGYIVFFVKPSEGYLLTGLGSNGYGDIYSLAGNSFGNISSYPGISLAAARAKAAGYVACFGYSRPKGNTSNVNAAFEVYGISPSIEVSASCSKTADVIPGDPLTFEVTITPQTVVNKKTLTVEDVDVIILTINGQPYSIQNLHRNSDGTYTGTVEYTASVEDCSSGKIQFNVTASVNYSYSLGVKDSTGVTGTANTTATTRNSASTTCEIASKQGYGYSYNYINADGITSKPEAVTTLPSGGTYNYVGADVNVAAIPNSPVEDKANDGIWVFDGWYLNGKKVTNSKVLQTKNYMTFIGNWTFINMSVSGYEGTYDGANHSISDPTLYGTHASEWTFQYRKGENGTWSAEKPVYKDAGTYTVYVKLTHSAYGELIASADVTIHRRPMNIKTESAEKVYDGTPLTQTEGMTVTGYVQGEVTSYKAVGTQTNVGSSSNTDQITWANGAKESNYEITRNLGTLTVKRATASISVEGYNGTYDGKNHSIKDAEITGDIKGTKWTCQYSETGKDDTWSTSKPVYKNAGTYTVYVKASSDNYEDLFTSAKVVINKVKLEVTTGTSSKMYDGTPLTDSAITVANAVGDEVSGHTTGTQTDVGTSDNTYELDWKADTEQSNYEEEITEHIGKLTITENEGKASLSVKGYNGVYDGKAHTVREEAVTGDVSGTKWTYTYSTTGKDDTWSDKKPEFVDAGTYTVYVKASNKNYKALVTSAQVVITKATIVVTTEGAVKTYDGTALTNDKITVTGYVDDEITDYKATGSRTIVGKQDNTYQLTWKDGINKDNYNKVEEHLGVLEVTKATATLTVDSYHDAYDSKGHSVENEAINGDAAAAWSYQYRTTENGPWSKTKPTYTDVGTYTVYVKASNANYEDAFADAEVIIDPRELKITTGSAERAYNGQPLTSNVISVEGFVNEEVTSQRTTGSQTNVGESTNTYALTWKAGAKQTNYKITETLGKLKVTKNTTSASLSVNGYSAPYDGQEHSVSGETVTGAVAGTVWSYQYRANETDAWSDAKPQFKDAGTYTVYVKATNSNYGELTAFETVVISKKTITVETGSSQRSYNGEALTNSTITVDGYIGNEITEAVTTGKQTVVGESWNTYALTWEKDANKNNYEFSEKLGKLTVTNARAQLRVDGYTGTYDANKHSVSNETVTGSVSNDAWTYQYSTTSENGPWTSDKPQFTNAGTYRVYVKASLANYNDAFAYADVTINKAQLTVSTGSKSKTYDGKPLTSDEITISGGVKNEVDAHTTGTQTDVGNSKNTYELDWKANVEKNNYESVVKENLGTLTVTENTGEASLSVLGYNKVYDGKAHSVSGETVTGSVEGTVWKYQYRTSTKDEWSDKKPEFKDAGNYKVYVKASNKNYTDLTAEADVIITKATIYVETASDYKVYDGQALTNDTITVTGFIDGEITSYEATGTQTAVGTSTNSYKLNWKSEDYKKNYNPIQENLGTLEITKAKAVLSVEDYTGIYDAQKHSVTKETITGAVDGTKWTYQYRRNKTDEWSTEKPQYTNAGMYTVYVQALNENYEPAEVTGTVTIEPKAWSITTGSDTKTYDGTPLTNGTITIEGILNNDVRGVTTGSQLYVGESSNTYALTWREGANSKNYHQPEVTLGKLKVTKNDSKDVTLTVTGYDDFYDGVAHSVGNETITGAVRGDTWDYQYRTSENDPWSSTKPNFKNAGTVTVYVKASNVNYEDVFASADVQIKKVPITVETGSASRAYDGKPLTSDVIRIVGNYVDGEILTQSATGSQTEVGTSQNTYALTWITDSAEDNYEITDDLGTLEITPNKESVSLYVDGYSGAYDGEWHSVSNIHVEGDVENTNWSYQYSATGKDGTWSDAQLEYTNAGSYTAYVKASNSNYADLIASADVIISKTPLTIVTNGAEKVYDSMPLTNTKGITVNGIVKEEITGYKATGSQTVVGSSVNHYELTWAEGAEKDNYIISETLGNLVVKPAEIVIPDPEHPENSRFTFDVPSDLIYNGQEQKWEPKVKDTATGKTLVKGVDYKVDYDTKDFTNVGNAIGVTILGIGNYAGTAKLSYRITPIPIELTAASAEKVYDATDLTANSYSITKGAFVQGEGLQSVAVEGSQLYVGTSENKIVRHTLKANTKETNYSITYVSGTLTVTDGTPEIPVDPDKVVVKTHAAGDAVYKLNDTIPFTIKVTNIYDEAKNITITEQENVTITGPSYFENVAPGVVVTTTAVYVVTEQDILAGAIFTNKVQAAFSNGKTFENTDEVEIDEPKSHLTVMKTTTSTPENGAAYALGETIVYSIMVKNDGNVTIRDIEVTDELTGDSWDVGVLEPGQTSEAYEAEYVVTEKDVLNGKVLNVATADGTSDNKENPEPDVEPGKKEDPVEVSAPSLAVIKTAQQGNYALGETVSYTIQVVNNGNVTISGIQIEDQLTNDSWWIESLEPNGKASFTAEYVITEDDIRNGSIHNIATAAGTDPEGKPVEGDGEETITPQEVHADFTLEKSIVNPKDEYAIGDTIAYTIKVTNIGNVTLNQLEVTDLMQNAAGQAIFTETGTYEAVDNKVIIPALAPNESVTLGCEYTVVRADAGASISNAVVASSEETPNQPKRDETDEKPVERLYNLVIHYLDENGNELANDYRGSFEAGEIFAVESPEIEGYTPNYRSIQSGDVGMPQRDLEFTVTYQAVPTTPVIPATIDTPDNTPVAAPTTPTTSVDVIAEPDENGDYQLIPIEDQETPLANMNLDDHACCILHFLIMLLALIIVLAYTSKMKKCQERIFELKEELERERKGKSKGQDAE